MGLKTFVHHQGAIGDVLLSLACIRTLKAGSDIVHLAAREDVAGLLKQTGCVDEISSADDALYASLYTEDPATGMVKFLSKFDQAYVFSVKKSSPLSENIAAVVSRTRTIITIPPDGPKVHAAEFRLKQLGRSGEQIDSPPLLNMSIFHKRRARELLVKAGYGNHRMPVAVHPGSGGKRKCWPLHNYFELVERVRKELCSVVAVISGYAEDDETKEKIDHFARLHAGVIHVCNEDLVTVAALLGMCRLYVGNDSGITHLAAAVNGHVIALFGPTDPSRWKPLGRSVHVVTTGSMCASMSELPVDEVWNRVKSFSCRSDERKQ
jgi:heptosyltransferase III